MAPPRWKGHLRLLLMVTYKKRPLRNFGTLKREFWDTQKGHSILSVPESDKASASYSLVSFQRTGTAQSIAKAVHLAPLGRQGVDNVTWPERET